MLDTPSVVVDSSVVIKWLNQVDEKHLEQSNLLLNQLERAAIIIFAPELVKYEMGNALLKGKQLSQSESADALNLFYGLPLQLLEMNEDLAVSSYRIAHQYGITFYDTVFLALAQKLNCPLISDNIKHQGKAVEVTVGSLANYSAAKIT